MSKSLNNILKIVLLAVIAVSATYIIMEFTKDPGEPSENLVIADDTNFEEEISKGIVLVDFYADWCAPCRLQAPIIKDLAMNTQDENVKIMKVDVDQSPNASRNYGIQSIPTMIIFIDGQEHKRFIGQQSKVFLEQQLVEAKSNL